MDEIRNIKERLEESVEIVEEIMKTLRGGTSIPISSKNMVNSRIKDYDVVRPLIKNEIDKKTLIVYDKKIKEAKKYFII